MRLLRHAKPTRVTEPSGLWPDCSKAAPLATGGRSDRANSIIDRSEEAVIVCRLPNVCCATTSALDERPAEFSIAAREIVSVSTIKKKERFREDLAAKP